MTTNDLKWDANDAGDPPKHLGLMAILIVGFTALTTAVGIAHVSPASEYELSVYTGTPEVFWVAVGIAFVSALVVSFSSPADFERLCALFLGGLTMVAIVGVPLLRGYAFYGTGDPLSHMGWIRNVVDGQLALADLVYPGLHSISIFVYRLFDVPLGRAMLISSGLFVIAYIVFLPLLVYVITDDREAGTVGLFSAVLLLPINNISIHMTAFPSTLAVFFVPLVLVLFVVYLTECDRPTPLHPVGLLLALTTVTMVMVHPQQASNLLLVFLTVTVLIVVLRKTDLGARGLRPAYGPTIFLAAVIAIWGAAHARIAETATAYSNRIVTEALGTGPVGTNAIAQRTGSLATLGVSTAEIGLKLFLVSVVYLLLTSFLIGADVTGVIGRFTDRDRPLPLLGLSLIPVGVVMVVYMYGGLETIYFRHLGFIMVLATILGSVGLWRAIGGARRRVRPKSVVVPVVVILFAAMTVTSLATVYSSPYIYKSSGHVTDQHFDGYETAFEYESEAVAYVGIRTGPDRFRDGIEGVTDVQSRSLRRANRVPYGSLNGDLTAVFDEPRYLVVTDADVQRETIAFRGLRYSERGFDTLGQRPGVNRVVSNDGFQLYFVSD